MSTSEQAIFGPNRFISRDIDITRRDDGTIVMHPNHPLHLRQPHMPAYLRHHAVERPDAIWLAQRPGSGQPWRKISFAEAREIVDRLTQGLLDLDLAQGAPFVILSGNSIEHALITLAAMQARLAVTPISATYSLQTEEFAKLRELLTTVPAGAVFAQDGAMFGPALDAARLSDTPVIVVENVRPGRGDIPWLDLASRPHGPDVERSVALIDPSDTAKLMFTSGSTGSPKAVIQSHRNIGVATESILTAFGQLEEGGSVRLDWAPWSHAFGATNLQLTLVAGGTFYVDDGRPAGPMFAETVRNLSEISTSVYASVPAVYSALVDMLEKDETMAKTFFADLEMLGYGGATLPEEISRRMQAISVRQTGHKIPFTSGYGSTETCPAGACVFWATDRMGLIGLPQPGYDMKLVPIDEDRYEVRLRGDGITSGYFGRPELAAEIFDEEGFYRIGDAASFADPIDPLEGLRFAGRLTEEFKLQTGTFVRVGSLRASIVNTAAPLLQDVVICGENRSYLAIMAWLNLPATASLVGMPDASRVTLNAEPRVRDLVTECLIAHNRENGGSSSRIARFLLLDEPASIDRGEATDKGSINQRAVQRLRSDKVEALFSDRPIDAVVILG